MIAKEDIMSSIARMGICRRLSVGAASSPAEIVCPTNARELVVTC